MFTCKQKQLTLLAAATRDEQATEHLPLKELASKGCISSSVCYFTFPSEYENETQKVKKVNVKSCLIAIAEMMMNFSVW